MAVRVIIFEGLCLTILAWQVAIIINNKRLKHLKWNSSYYNFIWFLNKHIFWESAANIQFLQIWAIKLRIYRQSYRFYRYKRQIYWKVCLLIHCSAYNRYQCAVASEFNIPISWNNKDCSWNDFSQSIRISSRLRYTKFNGYMLNSPLSTEKKSFSNHCHSRIHCLLASSSVNWSERMTTNYFRNSVTGSAKWNKFSSLSVFERQKKRRVEHLKWIISIFSVCLLWVWFNAMSKKKNCRTREMCCANK